MCSQTSKKRQQIKPGSKYHDFIHTSRLDSFTLVCYHLVPTLHKFEAEWISLLQTVRAIVSSCPVFQSRPAFVQVVGDYGDTPNTKDQHWLNSYSCCLKSPRLPSVAPHVLASQRIHLQVAKWAHLYDVCNHITHCSFETHTSKIYQPYITFQTWIAVWNRDFRFLTCMYHPVKTKWRREREKCCVYVGWALSLGTIPTHHCLPG